MGPSPRLSQPPGLLPPPQHWLLCVVIVGVLVCPHSLTNSSRGQRPCPSRSLLCPKARHIVGIRGQRGDWDGDAFGCKTGREEGEKKRVRDRDGERRKPFSKARGTDNLRECSAEHARPQPWWSVGRPSSSPPPAVQVTRGGGRAQQGSFRPEICWEDTGRLPRTD